MGFRSAIKKGGGFLNNVDVTLVGYKFEPRFKGETEDGPNMYFVPEFLEDGASEPVTQHMYLGAAERYQVSKDGQSLTMVDESPVTFGYSVPFGKIMDSLIAAADAKGEDLESELPDLAGGEPLNLSVLVDRRFRVKQEVDEKGNDKRGKREVIRNGKKTLYDRTNTVIEAILGSANGNGNGTAKATKKGTDLGTEAADTLREILAKSSVNRKDLRLSVVKALMKNARKDELKTIILDEEWQNEQEWLEVDKKGNLSAEA